MPLYTRPPMEDFRNWEFPHEVPTYPKRERTHTTLRDVHAHRHISVLFVDERNKVRSVLAQLQAELLRLWTLNERGYNLFSHIDSAGLRVDSELTRKGGWSLYQAGDRPNELAIEARMDYPRSKEGQDLKTRFSEQQYTRGLEYDDFDNFDYIITFDENTLSHLRKLEWVAYHRAQRKGMNGLRARSKYLGDFNRHYDRAVRIPGPIVGRDHRLSDFDETIRMIENEMHNFLHEVADWTKPDRAARHALASRYRSRQFLARNNRVTDAQIRILKSLYNGVFVDDKIKGRGYRVVTVTAREGSELREALEQARSTFYY